MRYFVASVLAFSLAFGQVAFAGNGWGTQENGYGQYHVSNGAHESNGAATGWATSENGNGYYHESNGSATISGVQGD
jgi:hypothetical protein